MRIKVILACECCNSRNYTTVKHKEKHEERLEANKYCKRCDEHTKHRETK